MQTFRMWLKMSLDKQQDEMKIKHFERDQKTHKEMESARKNEHDKVMAKIAYKEWKEKKSEEERHKRKLERMEKRRQEIEEQ